MSIYMDPGLPQWYEMPIRNMARRYKKIRDGNLSERDLKYHSPVQIDDWYLIIVMLCCYPISVVLFLIQFFIRFKSRRCRGFYIAEPNLYYDPDNYDPMKYPVWKIIRSDDPKVKEYNTKHALYSLVIFLLITIVFLGIYIIEPELGKFLLKIG